MRASHGNLLVDERLIHVMNRVRLAPYKLLPHLMSDAPSGSLQAPW